MASPLASLVACSRFNRDDTAEDAAHPAFSKLAGGGDTGGAGAPPSPLHSWLRSPARIPNRLRPAIPPLKNEILQLQMQLSNLSFSVFVFPVCRIQLTASHGAEGKEKCAWMLLQCIYSR